MHFKLPHSSLLVKISNQIIIRLMTSNIYYIETILTKGVAQNMKSPLQRDLHNKSAQCSFAFRNHIYERFHENNILLSNDGLYAILRVNQISRTSAVVVRLFRLFVCRLLSSRSKGRRICIIALVVFVVAILCPCRVALVTILT